MTHSKKTISILIPAYNEEGVLPILHERLVALANSTDAYNFEFLFVNDGSSDKTFYIIKKLAYEDPKVSFVNLSRNFGKEIAMIAGLDNARGDAVVILDADLQDPPELIPKMIHFWEKGYDDVYARRRSRAGESWLKTITSKWFYKILQRSTRIKIQRDTGDFRLLDRRCVEALRSLRESQRYTKGMFSWIGFNKKEISYERDARAAGKTKWNYFQLVDLAIEGLTSFTTFPLRWSSMLGITISFLSFLYIIVILSRTLLGGVEVAGYASLMAVVLFLGGIQLLSLGIIGEYVGRIFNETKQRPLYLTDEIHHGTQHDLTLK
jgi:polyisoprenyl-phosphate glycosyltransferase